MAKIEKLSATDKAAQFLSVLDDKIVARKYVNLYDLAKELGFGSHYIIFLKKRQVLKTIDSKEQSSIKDVGRTKEVALFIWSNGCIPQDKQTLKKYSQWIVEDYNEYSRELAAKRKQKQSIAKSSLNINEMQIKAIDDQDSSNQWGFVTLDSLIHIGAIAACQSRFFDFVINKKEVAFQNATSVEFSKNEKEDLLTISVYSEGTKTGKINVKKQKLYKIRRNNRVLEFEETI